MSEDSPETDHSQDSRIVEFDPALDSAAETVTRAVAEFTGTSRHTLPSLESVVNPGAMDALLQSVAIRSEKSTTELTFRFNNCIVTVHGHGVVEVARVNEI